MTPALSPVRAMVQYRRLLLELTRRDVLSRYKGSMFGVFWSLLTPLLMVVVFTFVFGEVFKVRWPGLSAMSRIDLATMLFSGLVVFNFFAEAVNRAPVAIVANPNYVKRVVFPLELLPVVNIGSALFHAAVGLIVLIVVRGLSSGTLSPAIITVPFILAPFVVLTLGVTWAIAALGVYVRDIGQLIGLIVTATMFLSPIFYPTRALPPVVANVAWVNPLSWPIEATRDAIFMNQMPDATAWAVYCAVALIAAVVGARLFGRLRRGFADVL